MIRRTRKDAVKGLLREKADWNVVELGCSHGGWCEASTYVDILDLSSNYPGKRFVQSDVSDTPFEDKEFDFSIASHIAEHVKYPNHFCTELSRISRRGYIEVPTPLEDNLVHGNSKAHLWWVTFDDEKVEVVFEPQVSILPDTLSLEQLKFLREYFRRSLVTELYWEDDIEYRIEEATISDPISTAVQKFRGKVTRGISRQMSAAVGKILRMEMKKKLR